MKIAYIAPHNGGVPDGIMKKIKAQTKVWRELGHDVQIFCYSRRMFHQDTKNYFEDSARFYTFQVNGSSLLRDVAVFNPDLVYMRYAYVLPFMVALCRRYTSILEINTNIPKEMKLVLKKSPKGIIRYINHILGTHMLLRAADGFCSVTHEIAALPFLKKYHKPGFVVPNGIDLASIEPIKEKQSSKTRVVFMGSADFDWNGTDILVEIAGKLLESVDVDIIGPIKPSTINHLSNVTYHGYLSKEEYDVIVRQCHIGIGTLALFRKDMREACPLKVREYLAYGLPVIIGYKDTAFNDFQPVPYVLELDTQHDSLEINTKKIQEFITINKEVIVSRELITDKIDVESLEKERLHFFQKLLLPKSSS